MFVTIDDILILERNFLFETRVCSDVFICFQKETFKHLCVFAFIEIDVFIVKQTNKHNFF